MSRKRPAEPSTPLESDAHENDKARLKREAWERLRAQDLLERDQARRALFDAFEIWTICEHKICRRNKGCRGDTDECVMKRWRRVVPDEVRIYLGKVVHFVADHGMTVEQAVQATEADLKEREAGAQRAARADIVAGAR